MQKMIWFLILSGIMGVALVGAPPTIALLSPQGGENWIIGSSHPIVWNTVKGVSGILYINLWGYNNSNQLIHMGNIAEVDYSKGSYSWKTGEYSGKTAGMGRYHIRVRIWYSSQHFMETWNKNFFRLSSFAIPKSLEKK